MTTKRVPPVGAGERSHGAALGLDQLLDDRQAQAGTRLLALWRLRGDVEPLEHVGEVLGPDTRPVVGDLDLGSLCRRAVADHHLGRRELDRVLDEVRQHLRQAIRVRHHHRARAWAVDQDLEIVALGLALEPGSHVRDQLAQVDVAGLEPELPGLQLGQVQEVAHQALQPL